MKVMPTILRPRPARIALPARLIHQRLRHDPSLIRTKRRREENRSEPDGFPQLTRNLALKQVFTIESPPRLAHPLFEILVEQPQPSIGTVLLCGMHLIHKVIWVKSAQQVACIHFKANHLLKKISASCITVGDSTRRKKHSLPAPPRQNPARTA